MKELVSDDDDPTAELEIPSFTQFDDDENLQADSESDSHTCGLGDADELRTQRGQTIPELQSDLESRSKTIGRLQYDIQQLRSKWLGLEAEIGAREEIVTKLLNDADELNEKISRKDKLLKNRSASIKSLKSEIAQRNKDRLALEEKLTAQELTNADSLQSKDAAQQELDDVREKLDIAHSEIVDAKAELKQQNDNYAQLEKQLNEQELTNADSLQSKDAAQQELDDVREKLDIAHSEIADGQAELKQQNDNYAQLEKQLNDRHEFVAEQATALEQTRHELTELTSELEATQKENKDLNIEVNIRDELESTYEQKLTGLDEQLASKRVAEANYAEELAAAANELARLNLELETARKQNAAQVEQTQKTTSSVVNELEAQREKTEQYADSLRYQLEDSIDSLSRATAQRDKLGDELAELTKRYGGMSGEFDASLATNEELLSNLDQLKADHVEEIRTVQVKLKEAEESVTETGHLNSQLADDLTSTRSAQEDLEKALQSKESDNEELLSSIDKLKADHEQEIRLLRFELTEAEESVTQTGHLNTQLAADLMSTRSTQEDLEKALRDREKDAEKRTSELEQELEGLSSKADELEQKLDTKNTAINVLLGELEKKTEQIESIGEIDEVIQEIDNRMSERFDEPARDLHEAKNGTPVGGERDRITRVLVGSIGAQELRFPLFKNRLTIGRTADNDIQLKTAYISRRHAVVLTEGDATRVIDWGSKNGVYVNSERVKECFLANGDIVGVGNAKFRYEERPKRDA
ncbi:MAG: FHA domain-containing protein [Woeseiaceae bacterium]